MYTFYPHVNVTYIRNSWKFNKLLYNKKFNKQQLALFTKRPKHPASLTTSFQYAFPVPWPGNGIKIPKPEQTLSHEILRSAISLSMPLHFV